LSIEPMSMENIDKNKFFKNALNRASKIVKNNDRLKTVIIESGEKLGSMNIGVENL